MANNCTLGSFQNSISIKVHIERKTRDRDDRESNQTLSANQKSLFFGPPNHVTLQPDSEHTIFSYFCGWHTNEIAHWINVHEWTEISLEGDEVRLHRSAKKRRNRIFVDGLADYVAIHYQQKFPSQWRSSRESTLERRLRYGIQQINLALHFRTLG